ncbi:MAG: hypothetical protein ACLQNE_26290 [Thermoguttaceae bacterium]
MATKRIELKRNKKGLYSRSVGWKRSGDEIITHTFYLGRDESAAKLANLRLEKLWEQVQATWKETGTGDRPLWDRHTLQIGQAIAHGQNEVALECPPEFEGRPFDYDWWIKQMAHHYDVIRVIPTDADLGPKVAEEKKRFDGMVPGYMLYVGNPTLRSSRHIDPSRPAFQQSFYQGLDAYVEYLRKTYLAAPVEGEERRLTGWGKFQVECCERFKERHDDFSLAELDHEKVEGLLSFWANRPPVKGKAKPISVDSADDHVKQLRSFFRWLHRSKFDWRKPEDFEEIKVRIKLTPQEIAAKAKPNQVDTFNLEELRTLYRYATPLERALMLLALNCGFGAAECASLQLNQVFLDQKHPEAERTGFRSSDTDSFIFKVRTKTQVYGEFWLWSETVKALRWLIARRKKQTTVIQGKDKGKDITPRENSVVLLSDDGHSMVEPTEGGNANQRIPNLWNSGLMKRVRKDHASFKALSFGKLRKTGGDLVKRLSDGEVSGVFLCHGTPVPSDSLQDVYTNRPFARVFRALQSVEGFLKPMFTEVPEPFPEERKKGGGNLSVGQIEKIHKMDDEGKAVAEIAAAIGTTKQTVYRRIGAHRQASNEAADQSGK